MASTSGRRVLSRRSHEKPVCKSDDPWCVVCAVNLALDGRTFTVVSSHQNSELYDVFIRVLAMTFTDDQAFVNVCNRCERQLKRLGRTTSIAMARQEGRKFRQQIEGNVSKHGLQGVVLGDFRNIKTTAPAVSSRAQKDDLSSTSGVFRRADTVGETSATRKSREMNSRSNSSVRVEEKEPGKRKALGRDLSAPERKVQAGDLHFSAIESSDRNKEVRRGNRSSLHAASADRTASFRPISDNTKSVADRRSKSSIPSQQRGPPSRDGKPSLQKMNSVDVPKKSGKLTRLGVATDAHKLDIGQPHGERQKQAGNIDNGTSKDVDRENNVMHDSWELYSGELNPFTADIERENSHIDTAHMVGEHTSVHSQHAHRQFDARDFPVLTDDDQFIQAERAVFMESSQSSQSSNEAGDNGEKSASDRRDESPQRDEDGAAQTPPNEYDNASPAELAADDESKDRTKRVTFSENVGAVASDEPFSEGWPSPQARQDCTSDKGKLAKYESIDLDIDKSNPFFHEVLGEYNRRVAVHGKVRGVAQVGRPGLQKTEAILESDEVGDIGSSHVEEADNNILLNGSRTITDSLSPAGGDGKQVEIASTSQGDLAETRSDDDKVRQHSSPGDSQQDSSPLIADNEDNRGEQKDVDEQEPGDEQPVHAEHEVRDTAGGEGEDWQEEEHGLIEAERLQQDNATLVSETEDLVHLELTTSSSFLRHDPDSQSSQSETPWLYSVSKVIQVTHLQPQVQLDDVDLKGDEEQTLVKDNSDTNSAQVCLQPMQMEDTSATKSEASPLIDKAEGKGDKTSLKGKDSKFKDQQPGLPCCTIL